MEATVLKCIGADEESHMMIFETPGGEKIYSDSCNHVYAEPTKEGDFDCYEVIGKEVTFKVK